MGNPDPSGLYLLSYRGLILFSMFVPVYPLSFKMPYRHQSRETNKRASTRILPNLQLLFYLQLTQVVNLLYGTPVVLLIYRNWSSGAK
jgi:hypothetical protein